MPSNLPSRGLSVQTFRYSPKLAIRLTYDAALKKQTVYFNNEVRSSFFCPPGRDAHHWIRGQDDASEDNCFSEWDIRFAVEPETLRIRYEISRRNSDGPDTKWYWYDRNFEPAEWALFKLRSLGTANSSETERTCEKCGETLTCAQCSRYKGECDECGHPLACPSCENEKFEHSHLQAFDVLRMQEQLLSVDAERLQTALIGVVGSEELLPTPWPILLKRMLEEIGVDTKSICHPSKYEQELYDDDDLDEEEIAEED